MKELMLFGKKMTISDEAEKYNSLRIKYLLLSKQYMQEFRAFYKDNIKNIYDYLDKVQDKCNYYIQCALNVGVKDLISYGIYNIDEVVLSELVFNENQQRTKYEYDAIKHEVAIIDKIQEEKDAERQELIDEAGNSWVGGGFGLEGAIKGAAEAAVLNIGSALIVSAITSGTRKIELREAEHQKSLIFENSRTTRNILTALAEDIFAIHFIVVKLVNDRNNQLIFKMASSEELDNNEPICRNIIKSNFEGELENQMISEYILVNPYDIRVYEYLYNKSNCFTSEVDELLTYFHVDMEKLADLFITKEFNLDQCTDYDSATNVVNQIAKRLADFNAEDSNMLFEVKSIQEKYDIENRTYRDYIYESVSVRDDAEMQYCELETEIATIDKKDLESNIKEYYKLMMPDIYPMNRVDHQEKVVKNVISCIKKNYNLEEIEGYLAKAVSFKEEYRIEQLDIIDVYQNQIDKIKKRLKSIEKANQNKEIIKLCKGSSKMNIEQLEDLKLEIIDLGYTDEINKPHLERIDVQIATLIKKDEIITNAGDAKEKALDVFDKIKSNVQENVDNQNSNVVSGIMSTGVNSAKNVFGNITDKVKNVAQQQAETKVCPQCGGQVGVNAKFCKKCGYKF